MTKLFLLLRLKPLRAPHQTNSLAFYLSKEAPQERWRGALSSGMKVMSARMGVGKPKYGDDANIAIPVDEAYAVVKRDHRWKRVYFDIVSALSFFAIFLAALFTHIPATSSMYKLGYSVSSTLAASGADTITSDSSIKFANVQTINDTFNWLTDAFVPNVFVTEDYNGNALEKDKWGRVAMFNKVLGGVVFNTTRASIHPCDSEQFLLDLYPNCYDPERATIDTVVITFDTNASTATARINQLKDRGDWLSFATQKLQITVVTYNGEVEAYTVTDLTVTFHQGGFVEPSSLTTPALSDPYKGTRMIVLDVLVGLLWLGRITWVMSKRVERGRSVDFDKHVRLSKLDFDLDLVVITPVAGFYIVLLQVVMKMKAESFRDNLAHLVVSGKTFGVDSEERRGLLAVTDSLKEIATLTVTLRVVAIIAVLLMGGMVLIAFHAHPSLSVLTRTIARALQKFGSVFVVFVVVFVTFSASGTVLFGDRAESFSSFGKSLETCINMLFGSFDYAAIQDMHIPAPMLFYWAYMIIVSLVLLNMMLAIVLDAYTSVGGKEDDTLSPPTMSRVLSVFWFGIVESLSGWRTWKPDWRACKQLKDIRSSLKTPYQRKTWSETLAHCRALTADEVVVRGRIRPEVLRLLLSRLCEARLELRAGDVDSASSADICQVLTATSLQSCFASAKITDSIAHSTMKFIRAGMPDGKRVKVTTTGNQHERTVVEGHDKSSSGRCISKGRDDSGDDDAPVSCSSGAAPPQLRVNSVGAVRDVHVAELLQQVADIQRTLALLVTASSAEKEASSTESASDRDHGTVRLGRECET